MQVFITLAFNQLEFVLANSSPHLFFALLLHPMKTDHMLCSWPLHFGAYHSRFSCVNLKHMSLPSIVFLCKCIVNSILEVLHEYRCIFYISASKTIAILGENERKLDWNKCNRIAYENPLLKSTAVEHLGTIILPNRKASVARAHLLYSIKSARFEALST